MAQVLEADAADAAAAEAQPCPGPTVMLITSQGRAVNVLASQIPISRRGGRSFIGIKLLNGEMLRALQVRTEY